MRKIPTIFERDGNKLTRKRTKGCEWVFKGEGCATEKLDGTNVRLTVRAGVIVRVEKRRNPTRQQKEAGIIDPWYVDAENKPDSKHILKAVANTYTRDWPDGEHCCEAIGPKIRQAVSQDSNQYQQLEDRETQDNQEGIIDAVEVYRHRDQQQVSGGSHRGIDRLGDYETTQTLKDRSEG